MSHPWRTRTMQHERLRALLAKEELERNRKQVTAAPPAVEERGRYNRPIPGGVRAYTPEGEEE